MSLDRNAVTAPAPDHPTAAPPSPRGVTTVLAEEGIDSWVAPDGAPAIDGYRIVSMLGQGGMGTVWRAIQLSTRRDVALKLLSHGIAASAKAQSRFEREVELAARLEHPNLARVYDSGRDGGAYFYAMELIEGLHLDAHIAARRCSKRQVLELVRSIARAIQHAHQRGVIHRDLKPSNILVTPDGQPHVVDFGLAKTLIDDDDANRVAISLDGDVAGTPAYMSPEQAAGKVDQIDTRSDVYSLGVILFQLLTGRMPHDTTGTTFQVMRRIVEQDAPSPRSVTRTIDRELEALLLKALARDPDKRYATAGELAHDLDNYLSGDPLTAKRPTTAYFLRKKLRKNRVPLGIAAAAVLGVLLTVGVNMYRQYSKIVTVPIATEPHGAVLYVDGHKHACGTPCYVKVGPGLHEIRITHPGGYREARRTVYVSWGVAYFRPIDNLHESEPIVLKPDRDTAAAD